MSILVGFGLISVVAIARISRTSMVISTMLTVIAGAGGTTVETSSRLKQFSMRSNMSRRVSWL